MKYLGIQTLRGIAALLVVIYHFDILAKKEKYYSSEIFHGLFASGFRGVDLFFVVSGFIMMHTLASDKNKTAKEFITNRALRILVPYLPIFIGMSLIYLLIPSIAQTGLNINFSYFLSNILLLPRSDLTSYVPVVAWSLTYELIFYAIFSLTMVTQSKWRISLFFLWMIACLVNGIMNNTPSKIMILDPLNLGFGFGMLSYKMQNIIPEKHKNLIFSLVLLSLLPLLTLNFERYNTFTFDLLIFIISGLLCASSTKLKSNIFSKVGDFSYSLYLIHYPLLALIFIMAFKFNLNIDKYYLFAFGIIVSIALSFIYYKLFEKTIYNKITSTFNRK